MKNGVGFYFATIFTKLNFTNNYKMARIMELNDIFIHKDYFLLRRNPTIVVFLSLPAEHDRDKS